MTSLAEEQIWLDRLREGLYVLGTALATDTEPYSEDGWTVTRVGSAEALSWFLEGHGLLFMCGMRRPYELARMQLCRLLCDGKCDKCPGRDLPHPSLAGLIAGEPAQVEPLPCPMDELLREMAGKNPRVQDIIATDYRSLTGKDRWFSDLPWVYVGPELFDALKERAERIRDLGVFVLERFPKLREEANEALLRFMADEGISIDPADKWQEAADGFLQRWFADSELGKARERANEHLRSAMNRHLWMALVEMCIWAIRQGVDDSGLMGFIRTFVASRIGRRDPALVDTVINDLVQRYRAPVFRGGLSKFVRRLAASARGGTRLPGTGPLYTVDEAAQLIKVERTTLYRWVRKGKIAPVEPEHTVYLADGLVKRQRKDMRLTEDGLRQAAELAKDKMLRRVIAKGLTEKKGITPRAARGWLKRRLDAGTPWDQIVTQAKEAIRNA